MPDSRWTMADARRYLAATGRSLAPGSMVLPTATAPLPGCVVDEAVIQREAPGVIILTLPFPPGVNNWLIPIERRLVKSPAHRRYASAVGTAAQHQYRGPLLSRPLAMSIAYHPPDHRAYDIDRGCKALLDGLEGIVYINDKQIKRLVLTMEAVSHPGYVQVTLQERTPLCP